MSDFKRSNPGCCECTGGDCPPGSICFDVTVCPSAPGAGATLTVYQGGLLVDTYTIGFGSVCFTTTEVLTYTYTVTKSGYRTASGSVTSMCGATVLVEVDLLGVIDSSTVFVNGCVGPMSGALVTVVRGSTSVASGVSGPGGYFYFNADVDGNYTVIVTRPRYRTLIYSQFIYACSYSYFPVFMEPDDGYYCCDCEDPLPSVLYASIDGESVTLTYAPGIGWAGCFSAVRDALTYGTDYPPFNPAFPFPVYMYPDGCFTTTSSGSFPVGVVFNCGTITLSYYIGEELTLTYPVYHTQPGGGLQPWLSGPTRPIVSVLYDETTPPYSKYLVTPTCSVGAISAPPDGPINTSCGALGTQTGGPSSVECGPYVAEGVFGSVSPGVTHPVVFSAFTVSE